MLLARRVSFVSFIFHECVWLCGVSCDNLFYCCIIVLYLCLSVFFSICKSLYVSVIILMSLSLQNAFVCYIRLSMILYSSHGLLVSFWCCQRGISKIKMNKVVGCIHSGGGFHCKHIRIISSFSVIKKGKYMSATSFRCLFIWCQN